eukprot:704336-Pelagomonas_calceolata.AAC.5
MLSASSLVACKYEEAREHPNQQESTSGLLRPSHANIYLFAYVFSKTARAQSERGCALNA